MAAFNALGTWGAIFLLHQFRGLQVSFGLQGSREPRHDGAECTQNYGNFNPQGSREPRQIQVPKSVNRHRFQATRLSRASTASDIRSFLFSLISSHKALASLDV